MKVTGILGRHPGIGMASAFGSGGLAWADTLTPVLEFSVLVIGLGIGIITLMLKTREWNQGK